MLPKSTGRCAQRGLLYHAHGVPVIGLQPIVVPCGNTPQGVILFQQDCGRLEEVQEVWAEEHVILHNDDMAVALLQKGPVQGPLVVLGQPSMPWLHSRAALCARPAALSKRQKATEVTM